MKMLDFEGIIRCRCYVEEEWGEAIRGQYWVHFSPDGSEVHSRCPDCGRKFRIAITEEE